MVSYFADGSHYPRSGRRDRQGDVYWANIAVNAATLRHVSPGAEFVVFAGDDPPDRAAEVLAGAGADIRHLDFAHRPPDDFYIRYVGSLYLLDALLSVVQEAGPDDVVLFVDPDIVWALPLDRVIEEVRRGGIVAYDLRVPDFVPMCDLTRREQGDVLAEMDGRGPARTEEALTHFGGEFYGMLGSELPAFTDEVLAVWDQTVRRYEVGLPHFNVEEHLVNAVLWQRGEQSGRANAFVERIRTLPAPFGTRERLHPELVAWHLPLEKHRGFLTVLRHLAARRPLPADTDDYHRWLSRRMGLVPTPARLVADRARQVSWKLTRRTAGATALHGL